MPDLEDKEGEVSKPLGVEESFPILEIDSFTQSISLWTSSYCLIPPPAQG
jgi:hypothetical protein